jgi:hypothetical protein
MQEDNNKPEFRVKGRIKITNERLLLIIIIIIISAFVYLLPTIYEKIMYIKTNGLFPKDEVIEKASKEVNKEEVKKVKVSTICTKTETKENGTVSHKVIFTHPNDMIKSTNEITSYISNEGEYMNEIDEANNYFNKLLEDFDQYEGFKIKATITKDTYEAELILDLSLLDINKMNETAIYNPLELKYSYNQKIKEVTTSYISDGCDCE